MSQYCGLLRSRHAVLTCLQTETSTDGGDDEEEAEWDETGGRRAIVLVRDGTDEYQQNSGAEELVEEATNVRHVVNLHAVWSESCIVSK